MQFAMFTKHLKQDGSLSLAEAADQLAAIGFDGGDLTVRPGGYVEPATARDDLPAAIELLDSKGLSVPMLTTAITEADEEAETIFEIADDYDIEYLKLGYWRYEGLGSLETGLAGMRADLREIARLSASYDVTPAVHIHSGNYLSAEAGILASVLAEFDPDRLGAYVDPGHMAVEGARSGWKMGLDSLADRIQMVAVKDYTWHRDGDEWTVQIVPLDQGLVDWPAVFAFLDEIGFHGPVSLHSEYAHLPFDELLSQTKRDLAYVDGILAS